MDCHLSLHGHQTPLRRAFLIRTPYQGLSLTHPVDAGYMHRGVMSWGALVVVLVVCAGQSVVVQVAAWSSMIAVRTPRYGFEVAWESTFSGRMPCSLCRTAALLRAEEGVVTVGEGAPRVGTLPRPRHDALLPGLPGMMSRPWQRLAIPGFIEPAPIDGVRPPALEPPPPRIG